MREKFVGLASCNAVWGKYLYVSGRNGGSNLVFCWLFPWRQGSRGSIYLFIYIMYGEFFKETSVKKMTNSELVG